MLREKNIISRKSSKFGKIGPKTAELVALERLENPHKDENVVNTNAFIFDQIFFIIAGNSDNHKSMDEFEIRPNPTTDYGVTATEHLKNQCKMLSVLQHLQF